MSSSGTLAGRIGETAGQCVQTGFQLEEAPAWQLKSIELSGLIASLPADRAQASQEFSLVSDQALLDAVLCEAHSVEHLSEAKAHAMRNVFEPSHPGRVEATFNCLGFALDSQELLRVRRVLVEARDDPRNLGVRDALSRQLEWMTDAAKRSRSIETERFLDVAWLFDGPAPTLAALKQRFVAGDTDLSRERLMSALAAATSEADRRKIDAMPVNSLLGDDPLRSATLRDLRNVLSNAPLADLNDNATNPRQESSKIVKDPKPDSDQAIEDFMPIIHQSAGRYFKKLGGRIPYDYLVQAGRIGLFELVERFNGSTQSPSFVQVAKTRIRYAMIDLIRDEFVPLTRRLLARVEAIGQMERTLANQLGRPATDDEMARAVNMSVKEYRLARINVNARFESLSEVHKEAASIPDATILSPLTQVLRKRQLEALMQAIAELPPRDQELLDLVYVQGRTANDVAADYGISPSGISRRISSLTTRLHAKLGELAYPLESDD